MRKVTVDMQNKLFSDAIASELQHFSAGFDVQTSEEPGETLSLCRAQQTDILLAEVTTYQPWGMEERMALRNHIKEELPDCKVVFIVDENTDGALAEKVCQAKKEGEIDAFLYGSVSTSYLTALVDTL